MTSTFPTATITGYPRIGPKREQKKALESFWAGRIDAEVFAQSAHTLRLSTYHRLRELGLDEDYSIPASYSHYDHVLDTALSVGLIASETSGTHFDLDEYFALARGTAQRSPLEMTKWFDTNYHYLVPELEDSTSFKAQPQHLLSLVSEAHAADHTIRPALVGPLVTLLALAKTAPGSTTSAWTFPQPPARSTRTMRAVSPPRSLPRSTSSPVSSTGATSGPMICARASKYWTISSVSRSVSPPQPLCSTLPTQ